MIELNIWADFIAEKLKLPYTDYKIRLVDFLEDNDWLGIEPVWENGALLIRKSDADMIFPRIETYFRYFGLNDTDKAVLLADIRTINIGGRPNIKIAAILHTSICIVFFVIFSMM